MMKTRRSRRLAVAGVSAAMVVTLALTRTAANAAELDESPAEETVTFTVLGDIDAEVGEEVSFEELADVDVEAADLAEVGVEVSDDGTLAADPEALEAAPEPVSAPAALDVKVLNVPGAAIRPRTGTYDVIASWKAKDGNLVYLRRAAYDKIRLKHNLTTAVVKRVTTSYSSRLGAGSATNYNYFLEAKQFTCNMFTCWVSKSIWVQSTVDYRKITSGTFGVVTTYCQGVTWCPDWVKNALNV